MTTAISPPPLAELNTLSALLELVNDPKKTKAKLDELAKATAALHDDLRKQAENLAAIAGKEQALNEKEVTLGQREAVIQAKEADLAAQLEDLEKRKAALRALVG